MTPSPRVSVVAPAKINLHLEILGRRRDGFHELRTLLQSIDLADEVHAEPAPGARLELEVVPKDAAPSGPENLVVRAAELLQSRLRTPAGALLRLDKRIPTGAGLGGGSADAAATLVALNHLWDLGLTQLELEEIGAELGSDVPFFLWGGLALGIGRGEEVYPLPDLPELGVLLVVPELEIRTAEVYRMVDRPLSWGRSQRPGLALLAGESRTLEWAELGNDLEEVVCRGWPVVAEALEVVRSLDPLHAAMSGSGSVVFALFPDPAAAAHAVRSIPLQWRSHAGRTLSRGKARPAVCPGTL